MAVAEANRLQVAMFRMQDRLLVVLEEHNTVYGDDGFANFNEIERKYRDYTNEALDGLMTDLVDMQFDTDDVVDIHADWRLWWDRFFELQSRAETAARNNDSVSMDSVRAEEDKLWNDWSSLFSRVDELTRFSAADQ